MNLIKKLLKKDMNKDRIAEVIWDLFSRSPMPTFYPEQQTVMTVNLPEVTNQELIFLRSSGDGKMFFKKTDGRGLETILELRQMSRTETENNGSLDITVSFLIDGVTRTFSQGFFENYESNWAEQMPIFSRETYGYPSYGNGIYSNNTNYRRYP
jgi:hypothetical protein